MTSGIYAIIITDHLYIGQSVSAERRFYYHLGALRKGTHSNAYMQSVFNKYGEESMRTAILQKCEESQLNELEIAYIAANNMGWRMMNLNDGGKNSKMSEATKRKISKANKGHKKTDRQKRRISETLTGRKHSDETKMKMSEAHNGRISPLIGRKLSDEHKKKISKSLVGNTYSLGYHHTDEVKEKISTSLKGRPSPMKGRKQSDEAKEKISESNRRRWARRKES